MQTKRFSIIVQSFHYDLVGPDAELKQDVQVAMRQVEPTDPERQAETKAGNFFEIMVPFDVIAGNTGFEVSGQITQIVQTLDYFGEAKDIAPDDLQKLSRPLVETIETLTYQVTAVALDQGISLNFQAAD
ncbi:DUF1149 family protein [Lacticaseibacillus brantae]|uniref:Uncharacterized protein n=1 Tax=Lacticaseibacillus brantae DSM 23927 TaxID=1423727 RepID=A0A0R2AY90_9LACO|nr:DUF1149 family protein [Lacticaseibacillus brantae]KRM72328.1 hypothetical protein FC34_GL000028 [Lacticaseibacillus brantae DSM 23927]